MPGGEMTAS